MDLYIPYLHRVLTKTRLQTPVLWCLGSDADQEKLLNSVSPTQKASIAAQCLLGVRAVTERNYSDAVEPLRRAESLPHRRKEVFEYRIYALCMSGQKDLAQRLAHERRAEIETSFFWLWMKKTFGIDPKIQTLKA